MALIKTGDRVIAAKEIKVGPRRIPRGTKGTVARLGFWGGSCWVAFINPAGFRSSRTVKVPLRSLVKR